MTDKRDDDKQPKGGPNPSDPLGEPQPAGPNPSHPAVDQTLTAQTAQYDPERDHGLLGSIANPAPSALAAEKVVEEQQIAGAGVDSKGKPVGRGANRSRASADVDPLKVKENRTEAGLERPGPQKKADDKSEDKK